MARLFDLGSIDDGTGLVPFLVKTFVQKLGAMAWAKRKMRFLLYMRTVRDRLPCFSACQSKLAILSYGSSTSLSSSIIAGLCIVGRTNCAQSNIRGHTFQRNDMFASTGSHIMNHG